MSMGEKRMKVTTNQRYRPTENPLRALALHALAAVLAVGLIWPWYIAMAQTAPSGSPAGSSVLSTGGGQALLDPSDTVILLLDHQAGLFQTVKDISVAELRANTTKATLQGFFFANQQRLPPLYGPGHPGNTGLSTPGGCPQPSSRRVPHCGLRR
jgi:hypothetical protein